MSNTTMDLVEELAHQRARMQQIVAAVQDDNARLERALNAASAEVLELRGQCAGLAGVLEWALARAAPLQWMAGSGEWKKPESRQDFHSGRTIAQAALNAWRATSDDETDTEGE